MPTADPSGLLQLGARFYWPEIGRFVQRDPVKRGTNWYAYVRNMPTVRTDPRGLEEVCRTEWRHESGSHIVWGPWEYAFTCGAGLFVYAIYDVYYRWGQDWHYRVTKKRRCCRDDECSGAQWECGKWSVDSADDWLGSPRLGLKKVLVESGVGITKVKLECSRKLKEQ